MRRVDSGRQGPVAAVAVAAAKAAGDGLTRTERMIMAALVRAVIHNG